MSAAPSASTPVAENGEWLRVLGRYLAASAAGHLVWEAAHMPLYTVWRTEPPGRIVLYGLHCAAGDVLIALSVLVAALLLAGGSDWPHRRFAAVRWWVLASGVGYTIGSEWVNTRMLESWTYADAMPVLPGIGVGLSPAMQWIIVPWLALAWAGRRVAAPTPLRHHG
ncbi:MAG: hypothetical protein ACTS3R_06945 [Inquilinaceae bacterium]